MKYDRIYSLFLPVTHIFSITGPLKTSHLCIYLLILISAAHVHDGNGASVWESYQWPHLQNEEWLIVPSPTTTHC